MAAAGDLDALRLLDGDLLADLVAGHVVESELHQTLAGFDPPGGEVASLGAGELLGVTMADSDLEC